MNQLLQNVGAALRNPHVRWSLLGAALCEIGQVWLPHYATQFAETQKILGAYAVIAANNSGPNGSGNTAMFYKTLQPPVTPAKQ